MMQLLTVSTLGTYISVSTISQNNSLFKHKKHLCEDNKVVIESTLTKWYFNGELWPLYVPIVCHAIFSMRALLIDTDTLKGSRESNLLFHCFIPYSDPDG